MASSPERSERAARRPQARGIATRERLLTAAEALFGRLGYEGTSIGKVAREAGVGVGTLYHHFADKRELLLELIDRWGDRLDAEARNQAELERFLGDDPRRAIRDWLRGSYERLRERPSLYLVALAVAERDPEVGERYRRIEALAIERVRVILLHGQRRGQLRADVDAGAAAFLIHHAIDVTATQLLVRRAQAKDADRIVDELAEMICSYVVLPASSG